MELQSEENVGSTFSVYLPLSETGDSKALEAGIFEGENLGVTAKNPIRANTNRNAPMRSL